MYKKKPLFIVFEGVEGCGKSFQSKKLYQKLKKNKIQTILTREPGDTKSAELIRYLKRPQKKNSINIQTLSFTLQLEMSMF